MTLLVADDDPTTLLLFRGYLNGLPYRVVTCVNGREALSAWETHHPEVAILDLRMPGLPGTEVARAIRGQAESGSCHIIAMSASSRPNSGVDDEPDLWDDYWEKPISREQIVNFLSNRSGKVDQRPCSP